MRRVFWMLVGAGLFWYLMRRGQRMIHRFTPRGLLNQAERTGNRAASDMGEFYATFKTSMEAKEAELRDELNLPARAS